MQDLILRAAAKGFEIKFSLGNERGDEDDTVLITVNKVGERVSQKARIRFASFRIKEYSEHAVQSLIDNY